MIERARIEELRKWRFIDDQLIGRELRKAIDDVMEALDFGFPPKEEERWLSWGERWRKEKE